MDNNGASGSSGDTLGAKGRGRGIREKSGERKELTYAKEVLYHLKESLEGTILMLDSPSTTILQHSMLTDELLLSIGIANALHIDAASTLSSEVKQSRTLSLFVLGSIMPHQHAIQHLFRCFHNITLYCALASQRIIFEDWVAAAVLGNSPSDCVEGKTDFVHLPLIHSPFLKDVFFLPTCQSCFPSLSLSQSESVTEKEVIGESGTSSRLNELAESLFVFLQNKPIEIFAAGPTSRSVGRSIREHYLEIYKKREEQRKKSSEEAGGTNNLSGNSSAVSGEEGEEFSDLQDAAFTLLNSFSRLSQQAVEGIGRESRNAKKHVSLLLVDRTLDLVSPVLHSNDNVMDQIIHLISPSQPSLPASSPCTSLHHPITNSLSSSPSPTPSSGNASISSSSLFLDLTPYLTPTLSKADLASQKCFLDLWKDDESVCQSTQAVVDPSYVSDLFLDPTLHSNNEPASSSGLEALVMKPQKEVVNLVKKRLLHYHPEANLSTPSSSSKKGTGVVAQLRKLLKPYKEQRRQLMSSTELYDVAVAVAVLEVSKPSLKKTFNWDVLRSIENILLHCSQDSSQHPLKQLIDLCQSSASDGAEANTTPRDIAKLAVMLYSIGKMASEIEWADEENFTTTLTSFITEYLRKRFGVAEEREKASEAVRSLIGDADADAEDEGDDEGLVAAISDFMEVLHDIQEARDAIEPYQSLFPVQSTSPVATYSPLLPRLVADATTRSTRGGWEYIPSLLESDVRKGRGEGLTKLISKGFFWGSGQVEEVNSEEAASAKRVPHPADAAVLIVFVIGGVTCREIQLIRSLAQESACQIVLGSTCIATGEHILDHVIPTTFKPYLQ